MEVQRIVLTVKDVATLLYCGEESARRLMKSNIIKSYRWNGKELRTTVKYVELFLDELIEKNCSEDYQLDDKMIDCADIVMNNATYQNSKNFLDTATKSLRKQNANK